MPHQESLIKTQPPSFASSPFPALDVWSYWIDAWQRGVLFLDVMQQRSQQYEEHAAKSRPARPQIRRRARDGRAQAAARRELPSRPRHAAKRCRG